MAEEFVNANLILPGTYIRVRSEGLIGVAGISTGNIGVVGTASAGAGVTRNLSTAAEAQEAFGDSDAVTARTLNLTRVVGELLVPALGALGRQEDHRPLAVLHLAVICPELSNHPVVELLPFVVGPCHSPEASAESGMAESPGSHRGYDGKAR